MNRKHPALGRKKNQPDDAFAFETFTDDTPWYTNGTWDEVVRAQDVALLTRNEYAATVAASPIGRERSHVNRAVEPRLKITSSALVRGVNTEATTMPAKVARGGKELMPMVCSRDRSQWEDRPTAIGYFIGESDGDNADSIPVEEAQRLAALDTSLDELVASLPRGCG